MYHLQLSKFTGNVWLLYIQVCIYLFIYASFSMTTEQTPRSSNWTLFCVLLLCQITISKIMNEASSAIVVLNTFTTSFKPTCEWSEHVYKQSCSVGRPKSSAGQLNYKVPVLYLSKCTLLLPLFTNILCCHIVVLVLSSWCHWYLNKRRALEQLINGRIMSIGVFNAQI